MEKLIVWEFENKGIKFGTSSRCGLRFKKVEIWKGRKIPRPIIRISESQYFDRLVENDTIFY